MRSLPVLQEFFLSFRQTGMDILSHHLQIMFSSYVLITYLNTEVSRTALSSLWAHSASYTVPCSQKNPTSIFGRGLHAGCLVASVSLSCICCFDCHYLLCPNLFPDSIMIWGISLCTAWDFCFVPLSAEVCSHVLTGRLQTPFWAWGMFAFSVVFYLHTEFSWKSCLCTALVMQSQYDLAICLNWKCLAPIKGKTVFQIWNHRQGNRVRWWGWAVVHLTKGTENSLNGPFISR